LQSALGVLGQGADPGKEFGKNKVCGGLIYTPAPVATCASSAVVCARTVSAPVPARARSYMCPMASVRAQDTRLLLSGSVHCSSRPRPV
jgi:hypothetical protein